MGYEAQVKENAAAIQKILSDAKKINELDSLIGLILGNDELPLYSSEEDKSVKVKISLLLELFANSVGYLFSDKLDIVFQSGQTVYNIPSKPDNIDLYKRGQWQVQKIGYDYDYNNLTGNITIYNANTVDTEYEYRSYGKFSVKQEITVGSNNQAVFNYSGAPANIDVYYEGEKLKETTDYNRTKLSENNYITITNQDWLDLIDAGKTIEIRKF